MQKLMKSPTPHGVGGLKSRDRPGDGGTVGSHPTRGGWIEIIDGWDLWQYSSSPTPHGVGGLK